MNILILSQCSAKKNYKLPTNLKALEEDDFIDSQILEKRILELKPYEKKACDLYDGMMQYLMYPAIDNLRNLFKEKVNFDHYIISAGFGLVKDDQLLVPYNKTFQGKTEKFIIAEAQKLGIADKLNNVLNNNYDLIFILVGEDYLIGIKSILKKLNNSINSKSIFIFTAKVTDDINNFQIILSGIKEASLYSYPVIGLKGYIFASFADYLCSHDKDKAYNYLINLSTTGIEDYLKLYTKTLENATRRNRVMNSHIEKPIINTRKSLW